RGAVTVLGGPHARSYAQDARKYFDYVLGFTTRGIIDDVLSDCCRHRPEGLHLSAPHQPIDLPGVKERWKYVEMTLAKAPLFKFVPMIGSLGCPYSCAFCVDAKVPYQPLDLDVIKEDLRFLRTVYKRPHVGWHDPNFGIKFDLYMDAIEQAAPPDSIDFIAECSLSLLSEPHLKRMKKNGFKALLPGIESWFDMGKKSKTGNRTGLEKVHQVADHVNQILEYIPYIQTNFVFGLEVDAGPEPFELTRRFLELAPGAFPAYSLLTSFGESAPLNLEYQQEGRVLAFPFHFMNNNHVMNVKPVNYEWPEFFDNLLALTRFSFSWPAIRGRFKATKAGNATVPRFLNLVRAVSSEGFGRIRYHTELRRLLDEDREVRDYWDGKTTDIPRFYVDWIKRDLGPFWDWLPEGALYHDPNAYLKSVQGNQTVDERISRQVNQPVNQSAGRTAGQTIGQAVNPAGVGEA
ncbi:MAG: radical SAM protein, partial [Rhodothermia bacterium]